MGNKQETDVVIPKSLIDELRNSGEALKQAGEALVKASYIATDLETAIGLRKEFFQRLTSKLDQLKTDLK